MINIDTRLIDICETTRPGNKLQGVYKIILHDAPLIKEDKIKNRNYINNLKRQDDIFMSYHYLIGKSGEIVNIIPEDEIAIHTGFLEFDLHSLSIALCYDNNNNNISDKTLNSLKLLLKSILRKYNLDPKYDLIRCYDVINKRVPLYFVENPYLFYDFKESMKFM